MNVYQYVDNVIETTDVEELNSLLGNGGVILNTYVVRETGNDGTIYEELCYSVGRVNVKRHLPERESNHLRP